MKKYELTGDCKVFLGRKLFRIRALISFGDVDAGDVGGYVEKEENLSQAGDAWVYEDAKVYGSAKVYGNAWVYGNAEVYGNAKVCGNAKVYGNADYATVHGFGSVCRTTTFFRNKNGGVSVRCGCFFGTLDEFREKVKRTHRGTKYEREYIAIADLMEKHFEEDGL